MFSCGNRPQQATEYLYQVICNANTSIVREEDEKSGFITETSWNISHLAETNQISSSIIKSCFPLEKETPYYLVHAIWSDNDDWNTRTRSEISFIQLFKDENKAQALCQQVWTQYLSSQDNKTERQFTLQFHNEDSLPLIMNTPWNGYFKYLDQCSVQKIELTPALINKYKHRL